MARTTQKGGEDVGMMDVDPSTDDAMMDVDPVRELDFGNEPAVAPLPKSEAVVVEYSDMPTAYDMLEREDIPLLDLITSGDKLIFKFNDLYFSTDYVPTRNSLEAGDATFYECKKELLNAPFREDVVMEVPYFRLSLNGNFTVLDRDMSSALSSPYHIFELIPTEKKLAFVSSFASVQFSPGVDGLGREIDISGSDHCQKGSDQVTYTLRPVELKKRKDLPKAGKKRTTYRKGKSKERKTYRKK